MNYINYINYMNIKNILFYFMACFFLYHSFSYSLEKSVQDSFPILESSQIFNPVYGEKGMVVSQEELASGVGAKILSQGGNAIDAAVAVGYALAVTLPKAGNIGGGGFMLIWLNKEKKAIAINYREKAPKLASKDMFLNADGTVNNDVIDKGYKSAGVPGTVYGLNLAHKKYGSLPLAKVMQPSIHLARKGIVVTHALSSSIEKAKDLLLTSEESTRIFLNKNKESWKNGHILIQKDLANTLEKIAKEGTNAFYKGDIAHKIVQDMKEHGGIITKEDLENYKAEEMKPILGIYRGYQIYSIPPPSSGGIILTEMLNILENINLKEVPLNSAKYYHTLTEIMNYAYYDRNSQLGDPHFVKNPIEKLTSKEYAKKIFARINFNHHTPSKQIQIEGVREEANQEGNTTHFSVIDKNGNMVSNTYTLNFWYGNGKTVKGTGILLNNEMGDFTAKVGIPNSFGLVQGEANAIQPQKRPLSSMTPTLVLNAKKEPILATGSPGGSRIITQLFQFLVNYIDYKQNIATASSQPRFHSQLWPDEIYCEDGISPDSKEILINMGHTLKRGDPFGSLQTAEQRKQGQVYYGAADPRSEGDGAVGVFSYKVDSIP
ncbi:gamma-glutamyltransferase [Silvanigrella aquatica]|uniref:Glutathione hydrolase proenzyme n=1 Tax=Silvanigrella aquatica TaxID=1915309 RepID=A0A1L4CZ61_9BACT|nr:gamma-glutamyltransferase [Silvanigrella aquatica]APJ03227.1 gamma-glutamyltransferase [Silvanigrella aquatica]